MIVVVVVRNCPQKLRGDLTKWLLEIDGGVFVGNLSARVRDAVWDRVCDNVKNGSAAMAFGSGNEQKLDFRIHNTVWTPVDYDGIKLIKRVTGVSEPNTKKVQPKAVTNHINRLKQKKEQPKPKSEEYVVIDIETTGLGESDEIIEIGAIYVKGGEICERFSTLVRCERQLPETVTALTGITREMLETQGIPPNEAIKLFVEFCEDNTLVGHNISFDMKYLQKACEIAGLPQINNATKDTMKLAKKYPGVHSFSLANVAKQMGIGVDKIHRVENDCELTYRIFEKLNEKQ